jgi:hypothetical protein
MALLLKSLLFQINENNQLKLLRMSLCSFVITLISFRKIYKYFTEAL